MSRRFRAGLVVGKFSPLHAGHCFLLAQAAASCEQLLIISYSRPEFAGCTADLRRSWLRKFLPEGKSIVIDAYDALKLGLDMPHNNAGDLQQRQFCADLIDRHFGMSVDAVFSSEDYGLGFADFLAAHWQQPVASVLVDRDRVRFPVSGSSLRNMPNSDLVEQHVLASQTCRRIALIGAESTGKTELGKWLAEKHRWPWVAEFGRQHWYDRGGVLTSEDLVTIARKQVENENRAVLLALEAGKPAVVCDTTPLTTLIYHRLMFDQPPPGELIALAERPYHELWLCTAEFPLVQDGTRRSESFRQRQQAFYHSELNDRDFRFEVLTGAIELRKHRLSLIASNEAQPLQ